MSGEAVPSGPLARDGTASSGFTVVNGNSLKDTRAALLADHHLRGRRFCDAYAAAVDTWLGDAFGRAIKRTNRRSMKGIALIAVGSYGRRELGPNSDLDLVLVHDNIRGVATVAEAMWYPVWDAGLQLDHSVRTPRETIAVAKEDLKAALGLLTSRWIAGDEQLAAHVREEVRHRWSADPKTSLRRLRDSLEERWLQHGELAFLLEPDIKLARGGLRDIEALQAAALATPWASSTLDDARFHVAHESLLAARVAIHGETGRRTDRLLVEDLVPVSRQLGFAEPDDLMTDIVSAARRIAWVTDHEWRRIDSRLARPRRIAHDRKLAPCITLHNHELVISDACDFASDPGLALHLAAASAETGVPIGDATLDRLQESAPKPPVPWSNETVDALLDLLGSGREAVPMLETLDQLGVLARYIPEWSSIRGRPQRNSHQRYTVDRYLNETVAAASDLSRSVSRPDLLLLAAWLHEIGHASPGAIAESSAAIVADIARRMGFDETDVDVLSHLVREQRLLVDTATRRDLDDPATIDLVAARVRSAEELNLLSALTHAMSLAPGPASWNPWNTKLIDVLVDRTRSHMAGETLALTPPEPTAEQRTLMRDGRLRVVSDGHDLTVVAPDHPGLLATIAGVLAMHRHPVRVATGTSEGGMVVDVFSLDLREGDSPDVDRIHADIVAAMDDPATLQRKLARRSRSSRPLRTAIRPAPPVVLFDNDATPRATIIEVRAHDSLGLLARFAGALAEVGCDIVFLRALTMGHEVVDTFYVIDGASGSKISDPARLVAVEKAMLDVFESSADDGTARTSA